MYLLNNFRSPLNTLLNPLKNTSIGKTIRNSISVIKRKFKVSSFLRKTKTGKTIVIKPKNLEQTNVALTKLDGELRSIKPSLETRPKYDAKQQLLKQKKELKSLKIKQRKDYITKTKVYKEAIKTPKQKSYPWSFGTKQKIVSDGRSTQISNKKEANRKLKLAVDSLIKQGKYHNNNLSEFRLLDNLPGRSDKGKKRKGIKGLIDTVKENPVEALAITAGGVLAARYGKAGIKTALRASKRIKADKYIGNSGNVLNTRETLGKAINVSNIPKSKVKQKQVTAIASAFLKGSGSKARKDIRNVKNTINYLKTGKK